MSNGGSPAVARAGQTSSRLPLRPGMDVFSAYQDRYLGTLIRSDGSQLVVRPGRLNLGLLTPAARIPTSAIRSISMERIVVEAAPV